jgi:hypothetical protein
LQYRHVVSRPVRIWPEAIGHERHKGRLHDRLVRGIETRLRADRLHMSIGQIPSRRVQQALDFCRISGVTF